jgi:hypothetical protein
MSALLIPSDQPSVFDVLKSLSTLERQAIVRPNDPPEGIAGFLFDIPEEEEINLRSEITDHYVEDNTAIQDQIALKPDEVTVRGLVAEIVSLQPTPTKQRVTPRPPLPIQPQFSPIQTPMATQLLVKASTLVRILAPGKNQIYGVAKSLVMSPTDVTTQLASNAQIIATSLGYGTEASQAWALAKMLGAATKSAGRPARQRPKGNTNPVPPFTPLVAPALTTDPETLYGMVLDKSQQPPNQTKQARAFAYFYQLQKARQLCTVETPWGIFNDMAILTVRATQDDESKFRSTFAITFKRIRTAGASVVTVGQLAGRAQFQAAPVTQNGNAGQTPLTAPQKQSLLYRMATTGIPTP